MKINILTVLLTLLLFTGCIKDGLQECPGNVRINLYAERFRNISQDPLADRERVFTDRISHIRYYLYREGVLDNQGTVNTLQRSESASHTLAFNNLEYGNYRLVVVANSTKTALSGNPVNADNLVLRFPGCTDTEDYFSAVFPFTVNTDQVLEFDVGLLRVHGVVHYRFVNMPSDVTDVEISMENVSSEKWITGDYKVTHIAQSRYALVPVNDNLRMSRQTENAYYEMGTFPTLIDSKASYHLKLYREGEIEPYLSRMISDTITIRRNQLLEIVSTFDGNGNIDFEINLNPAWDGSIGGGETGIH